MSSLEQILSNAVSSTLTTQQTKQIDKIYSDTIYNILSDFPELAGSSESSEIMENEYKPSNDDLDNMDLELENAIKLLSSSTTSTQYDEYEREQTNKFDQVENFLLKYGSN